MNTVADGLSLKGLLPKEPPHIPSRDIVLGVLCDAYPRTLEYEAIRLLSAFGGSGEQLDCILSGLERNRLIKNGLHGWRYIMRNVSRKQSRPQSCGQSVNQHDARQRCALNVGFELSRLLAAVERVQASATLTQRGVLVESADWDFLKIAMAYYRGQGCG